MKKKGIIIGISAAVATLVIGGGALITLTTVGIIGGVAIKNGKLSLFNKGGNAGNSTGLPANATIVTPGPTGTLWDTPMEYAINVPDSIFKAADGSVIGGNTDNYTVWNSTFCGTYPGPYDKDRFLHDSDIDSGGYVDDHAIRNMGNGNAIYTYFNYDGLSMGSLDYMNEKGRYGGSIYLGSDFYILNKYGNATDRPEMPLAFADGKAYFIVFTGVDYQNMMTPGIGSRREADQAEKVYLAELIPTAEDTDEDPAVKLIELEGAGLTLAGYSMYPATDRINLSSDNGIIYIMNYVCDSTKAFVLYTYDPKSGEFEKKEYSLSFDSESVTPLLDNGFVVQDGVMYMVYNNDYREPSKFLSDQYTTVQMGVISFDLSTGESKLCDDLGLKKYDLGNYAELYDREFKGSLCKNNDGVFFESDEGIKLRRRGETSAEIIFKNSTFAIEDRYREEFQNSAGETIVETGTELECQIWNVADGWLYYSDCYSRAFDHNDKSKYHPEDFIINRVNYNTGETQSICIFQLLLYGEYADNVKNDPYDTVADGLYDVLEMRFVQGIGGNSSVINYTRYMEYIEINDDGSWVLYFFDVTVHEVKTIEFDKTKQYEIP